MARLQEISPEIRGLIAQMAPLAVEIVSVEFEPGRAQPDDGRSEQ